MLLSKIHLSNFRNFKKQDFAISPFLTMIVGENARGKTSLLEGIYFSIYGRGFRETKETELMKWESDNSLVETTFQEKDTKTLFQITLRSIGESAEKNFYVNKTKKTHPGYKNFQTRAVLFAPEHILIIIGSPDQRRDYLNLLISSFDLEYAKKLRNYHTALRKRNKVLEFHQQSQYLDDELTFWNTYLEEQATYVTAKRVEYMEFLNANPHVDDRIFRIEYLKNEFTKQRLVETREEERRIRKTRIGPQKDDFIIHLRSDTQVDENVHLYGSRSQQRLAVFWLKINEIKFSETVIKKRPILLLDDIFSELDMKNKKLVLDVVKEYQTVATTTETELPDLSVMPKAVIEL